MHFEGFELGLRIVLEMSLLFYLGLLIGKELKE